MKISIIIPTWNRADLLSRTIASAMQQTYQNIEIIVADNASTDHTSQVVEKYLHDPRIQYWRNEQNYGAHLNFNQALIRYASGEFVLYLSDDDILTDSNYLSKVADLVESNPDIVLVSANFRYINLETGNVIGITQLRTPEMVMDGKWLWFNYNIGVWCPLLTTVFSREQALHIGSFVDIPAGDMLMFLRIMLNGKIAFLPDVVADYSVHQNSDSKRSLTQVDPAYENLDRIRLACRYAKKKGIEDSVIKQWKHRMMVSAMHQLCWDLCLGPALEGNYKPLFRVYELANEYGETEYLHQGICSIVMKLAEKSNLKNSYQKMDISL